MELIVRTRFVFCRNTRQPTSLIEHRNQGPPTSTAAAQGDAQSNQRLLSFARCSQFTSLLLALGVFVRIYTAITEKIPNSFKRESSRDRVRGRYQSFSSDSRPLYPTVTNALRIESALLLADRVHLIQFIKRKL